MKSRQFKQLANYSAMAGAFVLLNENAGAQIIYHDIDPDTILSVDDDIYYLDMDMDGEFNFYLYKQSFSAITEYGIATAVTIGIVGYSANDDIAARYGLTSLNSTHTTSFFAPYAFYEGELINNALEFHGGSDMAHLQDSYAAGGGWGYWFPDTEDKYLGVRFKGVDEEIHYGWIRCSVVDDYVLIIKDYAYNSTPDAPVYAGATLLEPALTSWIEVIDAGDDITGEDLHFSFNKSPDDNLLLEYRVIAVKDTAAPGFELTDAINILPGNYLSIIPDGSELYFGNFTGINDADGDPVVNNIAYKLFIYLVGNLAAGEADAISPSSDLIMLQTTTQPVTGIVMEDIGENGNATDIHLQFNQAENEQVISSYRIFVLDVSAAFGGFTVSDALAVLPENYIEISPTGAPVELILPFGATDINGNEITWGTPYYIFVMSVDNGLGTGDTISAASNELILNYPLANTDLCQNPFEIYSTEGIICISASSTFSDKTLFYLLDYAGDLLYSQELIKNETHIQLHLPDGIYIAKIISGTNTFTKKLSILHF